MADHVISVRIDEETYAEIKKEAEEIGIPISRYIRLILKHGRLRGDQPALDKSLKIEEVDRVFREAKNQFAAFDKELRKIKEHEKELDDILREQMLLLKEDWKKKNERKEG